MRRIAPLVLLLVAASLALAACGGPKNDDRELSAACARQIKEVEGEQGGGDTPTAKSTEDATKKESLNECAGQEKLDAAAAEGGGMKAPGDGATSTAADDGKGAAPAPAELDPKARDTFAASCGGCHMLSDAGTKGAVGPGLDDTTFDAAAIAMQIKNGKGGMPAGLLTGDDVQAVADYVAAAAAAE